MGPTKQTCFSELFVKLQMISGYSKDISNSQRQANLDVFLSETKKLLEKSGRPDTKVLVYDDQRPKNTILAYVFGTSQFQESSLSSIIFEFLENTQ